MQLPFAGLLGLASGAVGFVQKVFTGSSGSGKGNFDAALSEAMTGNTTSKTQGLMSALTEKGITDEDVIDSLMGCLSGMTLFQFMTELNKIGISAQDMGFLLSGDGASLSDGALENLLSSFGLDTAGIEKILSDTEMSTRIKEDLAGSFKDFLQVQASSEGLDADVMVKLATTDASTVKKLVETVQTELNDSVGKDKASIISSQASAGISHMIAKALKSGGDVPALGEDSGKVSSEASVDNMVQVAEKTLGISKDTLGKLFFSTDSLSREDAVSQVTKQVNTYLSAQGTTPLKEEVVEALSLIKSAMSEKEFSGIENSIKLWKPELALTEFRDGMNVNLYKALARQLSPEGTGVTYENQMKQVMDQLRSSLSSHLKNGEGSVTLRLHPPMLGRVDVNMSMNDGQLQAAFKTDQVLTRDIILQNIQVLKDALADQGIRASSFTVTSGMDSKGSNEGYTFAGQDRNFSQSGRGNWGTGHAFRDDEEFMYSSLETQTATTGGLDIFA